MAVEIAIKVLEELKAHGLNDGQLIEVLVAGYSPGGPLTEHGDIPQVHEIWSKLLNKIKRNEKLNQLESNLHKKVEEKIRSVGFIPRLA